MYKENSSVWRYTNTYVNQSYVKYEKMWKIAFTAIDFPLETFTVQYSVQYRQLCFLSYQVFFFMLYNVKYVSRSCANYWHAVRMAKLAPQYIYVLYCKKPPGGVYVESALFLLTTPPSCVNWTWTRHAWQQIVKINIFDVISLQYKNEYSTWRQCEILLFAKIQRLIIFAMFFSRTTLVCCSILIVNIIFNLIYFSMWLTNLCNLDFSNIITFVGKNRQFGILLNILWM